MVLKGKYIWGSYNNRKYFTLGGAEQRCWLMDIEKYVVGSWPPVGVSFQCPPPLLCQGPLPSFPAWSPHSQWSKQRWGVMQINEYFLGSPSPVEATFGVPITSLRTRFPPLTPKELSTGRAWWISRCTFWCSHYMLGQVSVCPPVLICWDWLPSLPAYSPHSSSLQLAPARSSSLPMANEQFSMYWGPHHLWGGKGLGGELGASWEQAGVSWEWAGSKLEQAGVRQVSQMLY